MSVADYRMISDGIAADIAQGRMPPGSRMPTQRQFAHERGIAVSTASRVYAELTRRGLVVGEVGRGTFIRNAEPDVPSAGEAEGGLINLEHVFSILPHQAADLAASLTPLLDPVRLQATFSPVRPGAAGPARAKAAGFFARGGWSADPETVLFTGTGRQGIAAAMTALALPGDRIGVEAMTYPIVKGLGHRLGIELVPLPMDAEGVIPDTIERAHGEKPLRALYLQPVLQSPLGQTMSAERRRAVSSVLQRNDLVCIEDSVYGFLCDDEPLAALAPDHVIVIDSLSKRLAPGLSLGFVAAPASLVQRLGAAIRTGAWTASGLPLAMALHLIGDGTARRIETAKRADATARQNAAREALAGLDVRGDPRAFHLWLSLPTHWSAERYAAAAARNGVAVSPASAFAIGTSPPENGVRLALASPPFARLDSALRTLRRLVLDGDEAVVE